MLSTEEVRRYFDYDATSGRLIANITRSKAPVGHIPKRPNGRVSVNGGTFSVTHLILAWHGVAVEEDQCVLFKDRNSNNTRIENMVLAGHPEKQTTNRRALPESGYRNVHYYGGKYHADVSFKEERLRKGFDKIEDAVTAANEFRIKLHGPFAFQEEYIAAPSVVIPSIIQKEIKMSKQESNMSKLSIMQNMQLCNAILAEYAQSGLNDTEFARLMTEKLGFQVNPGHVNTRRHGLNIKGNRVIAANMLEADAVITWVDSVEELIEYETIVNKLVTALGGV